MSADFANVIVAVAAVIVAIASIRFTNRGIEQQREHNIISVKPIPFIALADYENLLRVKVRNDGIGPLIVKKVLVYRKGALPDFEELVSYMPSLPDGLAWKNFSSGYVRSIPVGAELILLELEFDQTNPRYCAFRDQCREVLGRVEVRVKYTDVYNSDFADEVRFLDFFSRRLASSKVSVA